MRVVFFFGSGAGLRFLSALSGLRSGLRAVACRDLRLALAIRGPILYSALASCDPACAPRLAPAGCAVDRCGTVVRGWLAGFGRSVCARRRGGCRSAIGGGRQKKISKKGPGACRSDLFVLYLHPQQARELSSAGSERLPYKQRVGGSNPSAPTNLRRQAIDNHRSFFFVSGPLRARLRRSFTKRRSTACRLSSRGTALLADAGVAKRS